MTLFRDTYEELVDVPPYDCVPVGEHGYASTSFNARDARIYIDKYEGAKQFHAALLYRLHVT